MEIKEITFRRALSSHGYRRKTYDNSARNAKGRLVSRKLSYKQHVVAETYVHVVAVLSKVR